MLANLAMQNKKYIIYPQTNLKGFFAFCILYCIDLQRAALSAMQEKCVMPKREKEIMVEWM